MSGTLGNNDNMYGIGFSQKLGKVSEIEGMTEDQLRDKVAEIHDQNKVLREENGKLKNEASDLKAKDASQEAQIASLTTQNADLEKAYSLNFPTCK